MLYRDLEYFENSLFLPIFSGTVSVFLMLDVFAQIGSLENHYHFHHSKVVRRAAFSLKGPHSFIHMDHKVRLMQVKMYNRGCIVT